MGTKLRVRLCLIVYTIVPDFFLSTLSGKENKPRKKRAKFHEGEPLDLSAEKNLFVCTRCTKCYQLRHSLTRHLKFECGIEPMYTCNFCDRKFKHKYDLSVHEKGKHGIKNVSNIKSVLGKTESVNLAKEKSDLTSFPAILRPKN